MTFLKLLLLNSLLFTKVTPDFWNKEEMLKEIKGEPEVPEFQVKEVYKRECCLSWKTTEGYMPLWSEKDQKDVWQKVTSWKHCRQTDKQNRPYRLDCFKSLQTPDHYLARIFCDPAVILMELLVSDCEKVREVIKITDMEHPFGQNYDYHQIIVGNVKFPRKDPSKLRDENFKEGDPAHYRCVHFKVHEDRDKEEDCDTQISFNSDDWVEDTDVLHVI